ncbi:hypothetical protein CONPUDRAFT_161784 [Coniophora puteana RWD-64-598 SS2]|uniref:Uncharacterized protein n=1 Tax=Coniophora puteana (strain RWD-64-598) TaxID=741705 RepID=A0A5M3N6X5_CONPW|nr:uncharacterized protein CONPUDRAFT_161784 [Coniophora puteana RWD-64-598 SS2]EIW87189.1 hypothetical protein CONPUDRAFT_161784 [Coniophora puteana RWD-64-598 SS2]
MSGQYWFPNMPIPEIMTALNEWNISVSTEQLVRPTERFVTDVYAQFLVQVTSVTNEALGGAVENALAELDDPNPDLYKSAIAHNFLVQHVARFAAAARITDFSSKDMAYPDAERTRFILSAFINFVKFTEQCEPFVANLRQRAEQVVDEREAAASARAQIEGRLNALKAKRAEDEPRVDALRRENGHLTAHLLATKETTKAISKDIEALKVEKAAVLARKEGVLADTALLMDNVSRTRGRIVQSPERIRRNISSMGASAAEDRKTVAANEAKARELQTKVGVLAQIEKEVRSCVEQLQTIEKEAIALDASQKELADLRDSLDYRRIERSELQMKRERAHKQLANAHEKLERAARHAEERRAAAQATLDRLKDEYDDMLRERQTNDAEIEGLRGEADEIERQMGEHLRKSEGEINELLAEYWKLRHETEVYMETLANKLNMSVEEA